MKASKQQKLIQLKLKLKPNISVGEMGKYLNEMESLARSYQQTRQVAS